MIECQIACSQITGDETDTWTTYTRATDIAQLIRSVWDTAAERVEELGTLPDLEYIVYNEGGEKNTIWMKE